MCRQIEFIKPILSIRELFTFLNFLTSGSNRGGTGGGVTGTRFLATGGGTLGTGGGGEGNSS